MSARRDGETENRITEQRLALFSDRINTATMCANQLQLIHPVFGPSNSRGLFTRRQTGYSSRLLTFQQIVLAGKKQHSDIWTTFIEDTYPTLRRLDPPRIPRESDYFAVIVEPRCHPYLEYVIRNVMHFLGPEWGLQIYVSEVNYRHVLEIVDGWGAVYLQKMNASNLSIDKYNHLKKSLRFWKSVKGKHQFCFEVDGLLRRSGIERYLEYDYIGAPWRESLSVAKDIRIGNSGVSLRQRWAMLDIVQNCNTHPSVIPLEDVFFSVHLSRKSDRYKLPSLNTASSFSVESVFHPDPLAVHKPWEYLSAGEVESLLETIDYGSPRQ